MSVGRRSRDVADCVYFYIRKIGPRKKGVRITQEPMKNFVPLVCCLSLVLYFSLTCYHDNSYGHFHLFYDNRGELLWDKRFFATINSTWRSSFHPTTIYLPLEVEKRKKKWEKRQVNREACSSDLHCHLGHLSAATVMVWLYSLISTGIEFGLG